VKHGGNGRGDSKVRVGLARQDRGFVLHVEDDGLGFDPGAVRQRSSGLQLVEGLARQLRGRFTVARTPATRCSVQFS